MGKASPETRPGLGDKESSDWKVGREPSWDRGLSRSGSGVSQERHGPQRVWAERVRGWATVWGRSVRSKGKSLEALGQGNEGIRFAFSRDAFASREAPPPLPRGSPSQRSAELEAQPVVQPPPTAAIHSGWPVTHVPLS